MRDTVRRRTVVGAATLGIIVLAVSTPVAHAGPTGSSGGGSATPPIEAAGHGALQSVMPLDGGWEGLDNTYRIAYTTTGAGGDPVTATGIVRIPTGPVPPGGWPIVSWAHGTSGMGAQCGLADNDQLAASTASTVEGFNAAGYAVVATDYVGLSPDSPGPHPYLQSSTEGAAVVDIVRAGRSAFDELSDAWVAAGSSQGGHAALAAGSMAAQYAPDLALKGVAALAPESNLENVFLLSRPGIPSVPGFPTRAVATVLAGMNAGQNDVDVQSYLTPLGKRVISQLADECVSDWNATVGDVGIGELLSEPLDDPNFSAAMRAYMGVPLTGYTTPVSIVHGARDTTVPLPFTLALLAQFSAHGVDYRFQLVEDAGHEDLRERGGLQRAIDFTKSVMPE